MKQEMTIIEAAKKTLKMFIEFKGKLFFASLVGFSLILSIVLYIEPLLMNNILMSLEDYVKTGTLNTNGLITNILVLVGYSIFSVIMGFIYYYYFIDVNNLNFHVDASLKYMKDIIKIHYSKYLDKKPGTVFKNFNQGIDGMLIFLFDFLKNVLRSIFGLILGIAILFLFNVKLAIAALSMVPIIIFMGFFFHKKTREKQDELHKRWNNTYGIFGQAITNLAIVKTLRLENLFQNKFKKEVFQILEDQYSVSKRWQLASVYTMGVVTLGRTIVLATGIFLIQSGEITYSTLFIFFMYMNAIYYPLIFLFEQLKSMQQQLSRVKIFFDEFDSIMLDKDNPESKDVEKVVGKIEFKNINFSYTEDKQTLENINFEINPGEKIALVGNTGSGKTTITNLLIRFWEPNSGEILLDGQNVANITKSSLRQNIGLVMQDNTLFNDTIRENLLYAKAEASEDEITKALKLAKADFVLKLKDGLDTVIGERGLKLSGGEKQRLSIARIILKNPQILVLDEATSALDNKTEVEVKTSLDKLMRGKTSIIIAHRLSTVKNADKIFVLENGKIIESGKFDELMNKKGKFYDMANPDRLVIAS